jgi:hypothetical protein
MGEFDTCRTIKELVESGLAEVDTLDSVPSGGATVSGPAQTDAPAPTDAADAPSDEELVELPKRKPRSSAAKAKVSPEPEAEPAAEAKPDEEAAEGAFTSISAAAVAAAELPEAEAKVLVEQLAALGDDEEAAKELARRVVAGEDLGDGDDEPINRGLLLKFLSSVRS